MTDSSRVSTSHIGSLPRPPELLRRLEESETGEASGPDFAALVERAIHDAIEKQAEIGIDVANNGELGRTGFHIHVLDRLAGFEGEGVAPFWGDVRDFPALAEHEFNYPEADPDTGAPVRPAATGPVRYRGSDDARREVETFLDALEATGADFQDVFMTAPSPGIVATSLPNEFYDSHREYLRAIAEAMRQEYELIAGSGALLQVDAPDLLHTHHREFHDGRDFGHLSPEEYRDVLRLHVDAINDALADVPSDRVRLHTCWGNYEGPHHEDLPLADALPVLYDLDVGYLAIESTGPRHEHEYEAFGDHPLPDDMTLMPGVVDVKSNVIDHPETVAARLERFVEVVGDPSQLLAVPDCGFGTLAWSSAYDGIAWAKLESLVRGAELASDRLF